MLPATEEYKSSHTAPGVVLSNAHDWQDAETRQDGMQVDPEEQQTTPTPARRASRPTNSQQQPRSTLQGVREAEVQRDEDRPEQQTSPTLAQPAPRPMNLQQQYRSTPQEVGDAEAQQDDMELDQSEQQATPTPAQRAPRRTSLQQQVQDAEAQQDDVELDQQQQQTTPTPAQQAPKSASLQQHHVHHSIQHEGPGAEAYQDEIQLDHQELQSSPTPAARSPRLPSWRQEGEPMFVKHEYPSGLTPFPAPGTVDPERLPPVKNFAPGANHPTKLQLPERAEDELVTFCVCKAKAKWIDAGNETYIQCYSGKCAKFFHKKCVEYEEPEDYRNGWLCPDCGWLEEDEAEASESEEEVRPKPKKPKKKAGKRKARG